MSLFGRFARSLAHTLGARREPSPAPQAEKLIAAAAEADAAGDHRAAEALCREAIAVAPDAAAAWMGLGLALQLQNRLTEALPPLERAVALAPASAAASYNLGRLHHAASRFDAATAALSRALRIDSRFIDALILLAEVRSASGDGDGAVAALRAALDIDPAHEGALGNCTLLLRARREYEEIVRMLSRAVEAAPQSALTCNGLAIALVEVGRVDEALDVAVRALAEHPSSHALRAAYLSTLLITDRVSAEDLTSEHLRIGGWFDAEVPARAGAFRNDRDPARRLRVGYVSGDFRQQSLAIVFEPVLRRHDRAAITPIAYSYTPVADAYTERFRAQFDLWRDVAHLDNDALARTIEADGIDILVDLAGYFGSTRMGAFARRPAPVQVAGFVYLVTRGLTAMTHRLSDAVLDPPGGSGLDGSEKVMRLAGGLWCYQPPPAAALEPARELAIDAPVHFGSFNRFAKISASTIGMWTAILRGRPNARLTVMGAPEGEARARLRERFSAAGVAPARIEFSPRIDHRAYYNAFNRVDVCLDTTPYSGAVTTCDSLWMGVPVVSLRGATPVSRSTASLLTAAGLEQWIAETPEDYVRIALGLAAAGRGTEERRALRSRVHASAVMDGVRVAREIERAYREMWREWCAEGR